jgi:uncharacterized damage-inducible protein DinB
MKNVIRSVLVVGLVVGSTAVAHAASAPEAPAAKGGGFQRDVLGVIAYAQKHILELEEAVPQNKFNWRPGPGVRSIAETYLHIAFSNYGLTQAATGKAPPADVGFEPNPAKWDKQTTDKAEIKKILERSFAHVKEVVSAVPDADLDKNVSFFGMTMTTRAVLIIVAAHANEHLGQEIAYARTNKIVPPWSKDEHMPGEKKSTMDEKSGDKKAMATKP